MERTKKGGNIIKELGPIAEIDVKLRLPKAFLDYIHEVAIKQEKWNKDLDEFCSDEATQSVIAYLDCSESVRTKDYVIPRDIASYNKQIFNAYLYKQRRNRVGSRHG
ncbi:MAG: hypothetical protein ACR2IS_05430 [Nitrososphaeraceae archaeon]